MNLVLFAGLSLSCSVHPLSSSTYIKRVIVVQGYGYDVVCVFTIFNLLYIIITIYTFNSNLIYKNRIFLYNLLLFLLFFLLLLFYYLLFWNRFIIIYIKYLVIYLFLNNGTTLLSLLLYHWIYYY